MTHLIIDEFWQRMLALALTTLKTLSFLCMIVHFHYLFYHRSILSVTHWMSIFPHKFPSLPSVFYYKYVFILRNTTILSKNNNFLTTVKINYFISLIIFILMCKLSRKYRVFSKINIGIFLLDKIKRIVFIKKIERDSNTLLFFG